MSTDTAIGFSSILNVVSWNGKGQLEVKPSDELPPAVTDAVKKIKQRRRIRVLKDGTEEETIETQIELHDKLAALPFLLHPGSVTESRADVTVQATATHFHLTIELEVRVNDALHFTRHWAESVPRHYL